MNRSDFIKKGMIGGALMQGLGGYMTPLTSSKGKLIKNANKILWEELTWKDIEKKAENDAVVIIPVGSIEQHGPHLPVGTDILISSTVSCRVAEIMNSNGYPTLVTPSVWTGNSAHHMMFPGTISFDYSVFDNVLKQICLSVIEHGFKKIVFINGHGGNTSPIKVSLIEINKMLGRPAFAINYWDSAKEELKNILDTDEDIGHSGEAETSIVMALRPELIKRPLDKAIGPDRPDPIEIDQRRDAMAYTFRTMEDRTDTGVIGHAPSATKEKGERILKAVTNNLAEFLVRESLWNITL